MCTHHIVFNDKINFSPKYPKIFVSLSYWKNFLWELKTEFDSATVNESSVLESLKFHCIYPANNESEFLHPKWMNQKLRFKFMCMSYKLPNNIE